MPQKIYIDEELLKELWFSTLTVSQIADTLGCSEETARRRGHLLGLGYRKLGTTGANHPRWKGGRQIDKDGYVLVHTGRNTRQREHRLVMENHLGRTLLKTEVVHHVNGNKQDNRIENLKLFCKNSNHLKESLTGKCPNWSPEGLNKIKAGVSLSNRKRKGNQKESTKRVRQLQTKNRQRDITGRFLSQNQIHLS